MKDFANATVIVANNDLKYEVAKLRAQYFARATDQRILWVPAQDVAKHPSLVNDPTLLNRKREWLQLHDRHCGELYGMLPLLRNMPIFLTHHVDRGPRQLLKTSTGPLVDWVLDEDLPDHSQDYILKSMPKHIVIKVDDIQSWGANPRLEGTTEDGIYLLKPSTQTWCSDFAAKFPIFQASCSTANHSSTHIRDEYAP